MLHVLEEKRKIMLANDRKINYFSSCNATRKRLKEEENKTELSAVTDQISRLHCHNNPKFIGIIITARQFQYIPLRLFIA